MLHITREEFRKVYRGTKVLQYEEIFFTEPTSYEDLIGNYMTSKLWRLNHLYTIVDKWGQRLTFKMRLAQHKVYAESLRHPRILVLKSRQQGISTLWLVSYFDDALFNGDYKVGLMAQGLDETATLLERTKILWDELDPDIKQFLGTVYNLPGPIATDKDNTKEFSFTNGSTLFVRTSFRSTTLQRLHISEFGKIANKYPDKAKETRTGTLQALAPGNTGVIESTAEGANDFKVMWDNAVTLRAEDRTLKDFVPVFLSWVDDPDCVLDKDQNITAKDEEYFLQLENEVGVKLSKQQKNFWIAQYRELGDAIYQEYPATPAEAFTVTRDGAYYARLYIQYVLGMKRKVHNLFDPNLEVQVSVDLGMNDTMVLTFFQTYQETTRIIAEYASSGEDIGHYCDIMKEWAEKRGYTITHLILPPDAEVRELNEKKTRKEKFAEKLGRNVTITVLEKLPRAEGIDELRRVLKNLWIDVTCSYLEKCFLNYRKKWDEKAQVFTSDHHHDEYSNGADSMRYMALGARVRALINQGVRPSGSHRRIGGSMDV